MGGFLSFQDAKERIFPIVVHNVEDVLEKYGKAVLIAEKGSVPIFVLKTPVIAEVLKVVKIISADLFLWDAPMLHYNDWHILVNELLNDFLCLSPPARFIFRPCWYPSCSGCLAENFCLYSRNREMPIDICLPIEYCWSLPLLRKHLSLDYKKYVEELIPAKSIVTHIHPGKFHYGGILSGHVFLVVESVHNCNGSCSYCFRKFPWVGEKPKRNFATPGYVASVASKYEHRQGVLHGGDVTTLPPAQAADILEMVPEISGIMVKPSEKVVNWVKQVARLTGKKIQVSCSCDPEHKCTYSDVAKYMSTLGQSRTGTIYVVTESNWKSIPEYIRELEKLRKTTFEIRAQFNWVFGRGPQSIDADYVVEILFDAFMSGFHIEPITRIMSKFLSEGWACDCAREPLARTHIIGLTVDGMTGGCDIFTGWRTKTFAWTTSIEESLNPEVIASSPIRKWMITEIPRMCWECKVLPFCMGGCPLRRDSSISYVQYKSSEELLNALQFPKEKHSWCFMEKALDLKIISFLRQISKSYTFTIDMLRT